MKKLLVYLPLAVALTTGAPLAEDANWEGAFGAIATDKGRIVGVALNVRGIGSSPSTRTANLALRNCKKQGPKDNLPCFIADQKYTPLSCIAVAVSGPMGSIKWGWGFAGGHNRYERVVLEAMRDCERKGGSDCELANLACR